MGSLQQQTSEHAVLTAMSSDLARASTIDLTGAVPVAVAVTPQPPQTTQGRPTGRNRPGNQLVKWNFVVNNMPLNHPSWENLGQLVGDGGPFAFMCVAHEIAPTTQTPHMQGFVFVNKETTASNGLRMGQVVDHLSPYVSPYYPHVTGCGNGAVVHAVKYVKGLVAAKGNTLNPTYREWGSHDDVPGLAKAKEDEEEDHTVKLAEAGDFAAIQSSHKLRYYSSIKAIHQDAHQNRPVSDLAKPNCEWIWGRAGSGKTSHAITQLREEFHVECYRKQPDEKWWPAYPTGGDEAQLPVLIDDATVFNPKMFGLYKIWFDAYAFIAELKHGSGKLRPPKIVVTSQYHPTQVFRDRETLEAMMRRMKVYEYKRLSKPGEPYAFEKIYEPLTGTGDQDWALANPCGNNSDSGTLTMFNLPANRSGFPQTAQQAVQPFTAAAHRLWQTTHIAPNVMANALQQVFQSDEFIPSTPVGQSTRPNSEGAPNKNARIVVEKDVGILQDGKVLKFTEPKEEDDAPEGYICSINPKTGEVTRESILAEINNANVARGVASQVFEI